MTRAQEIKVDWKDEFVSVEHMLLAVLDDTKFGTQLLKEASLDKPRLEAAIKEIRGSNRVTDQVCLSTYVYSYSVHSSLNLFTAIQDTSSAIKPCYLEVLSGRSGVAVSMFGCCLHSTCTYTGSDCGIEPGW